jgi:hypothetical protein
LLKAEFMKAFTNQYIGRGIDFDGSYGVQCVDGAKIGMMLLGCQSPPATGTGNATGYWYNRNSLPWISDQMQEVTSASDVNVGDMVIFSDPSPTGHVAWYAGDGQIFGQNQDGRNDGFSLRPMSNWSFLGALRFKGFDDFSQPVHGLDGENMNYQYQTEDFNTNFNINFGQAVKGIMWRNNKGNHVYHAYKWEV